MIPDELANHPKRKGGAVDHQMPIARIGLVMKNSQPGQDSAQPAPPTVLSGVFQV
jgi:hypothetical protein